MSDTFPNPQAPTHPKLTPIPPDPASAVLDESRVLRQLIGRILEFNPFYIISAALFLYGIFRLSTDPGMFRSETRQLVFNFSSLQVYEIALVGTAVWLFSRSIRHDSAVLVGLENMLVLVPFILVSHAVFLGRGLAAALCLIGFGLAAARLLALRARIAEVNLPMSLLILGSLALGANSVFPFLFRSGLELTNESWGTRGFYCWSVVLPILLALGNLLPAPAAKAASPLGPRWMPLACYLMWMLGTGVHLGSIDYIDQRPLALATLLPALWALAWTMANRIGDLVVRPEATLQVSLLVLPLIPVATAMLLRERTLALGLCTFNAAIYALLWFRQVHPRVALRWLGCSAAALAALLMPPATSGLPSGAWPTNTLVTTSVLVVLACAIRSRNPRWGLLGAVVAAIGASALFQDHALRVFGLVQTGLVFLLLHSLRWDDVERGSFALRLVTAVLWFWSAWFSVSAGNAWQQHAMLGLGFLVLQTYLLHRGLTRRWASWVIPAAASLVILVRPLRFAVHHLNDTPVGLRAMAASILLLAIGTAVALRRNRRMSAAE